MFGDVKLRSEIEHAMILQLPQQHCRKSNAWDEGMTDRVIQLAYQIADGAASCDIEILCAPVGGEPLNVEEIRACWFDLNQVIDPADTSIVNIAVEYLELRGLLKRHPVNAHWVRPRHPGANDE
ncbi:hypothetical protein EGT07_12595 [Herbaspirillum sp. HC18]|nr:hypothetical protein EGT07_12595 [Herbaspirillum sp. HC18]